MTLGLVTGLDWDEGEEERVERGGESRRSPVRSLRPPSLLSTRFSPSPHHLLYVLSWSSCGRVFRKPGPTAAQPSILVPLPQPSFFASLSGMKDLALTLLALLVLGFAVETARRVIDLEEQALEQAQAIEALETDMAIILELLEEQ
jgi:hypothetical protein